MNYIVREGIVYHMIADGHYLISCGSAVGVCPAIQQISDSAAYYWKLLEQGMKPEQMLDIAAAESGAEKEVLRPGLERFLCSLAERKYLICCEDDAEKT